MIAVLEKMGEHRLVDMILAGKWEPEWEREKNRQPSVDWTKAEDPKLTPPDLAGRLEAHENSGQDLEHVSLPIASPTHFVRGFISPSGVCYDIGSVWHNVVAKALLEANGIKLPKGTSGSEIYKKVLQDMGWISFNYPSVLTNGAGGVYSAAQMGNLTKAQKDILAEIYAAAIAKVEAHPEWLHNDAVALRTANPALAEIFY